MYGTPICILSLRVPALPGTEDRLEEISGAMAPAPEIRCNQGFLNTKKKRSVRLVTDASPTSKLSASTGL